MCKNKFKKVELINKITDWTTKLTKTLGIYFLARKGKN